MTALKVAACVALVFTVAGIGAILALASWIIRRVV